jgi:lysophospholipase L1-like esterase
MLLRKFELGNNFHRPLWLVLGMQISSSAPRTTYKPKMVAVGDSLTAGMQDANLISDRQVNSYPALVARQAGLEFRQPLMDDEGIPPRLFLSPGTSLGQTAWRYAQVGAAALLPMAFLAFGVVAPEFTLFPLWYAGGMGSSDAAQGPVQNLAIPAFELRELSDVSNLHDLMQGMADKAEGSGELIATAPYCRHILQEGQDSSHGRSQIDKAVAQDPDLVLLWAGNNDALAAALKGHVDDSSLTPMHDQRWTYTSYNPLTGKRKEHQTETVQPGFRTSLHKNVSRLLAETDAEIVMMNIPDVTVVPFLHKLGERVGELPFRLMLPGGVDVTKKIENWYLPRTIKGEGQDGRRQFPENTRVGLPMILSKLTHYFQVQTEQQLDVALDSMNRQGGVFSEDEVLDPEEIGTIQKRTGEYNQLISELARDHDRIHLVDIQQLLQQTTEGLPLRGPGPEQKVTNACTAQGGIFSSDGIHPSDVGYAVVANRVLDTVRNELQHDPRFAAFHSAPEVDEKAALAADPHRAGKPTLMLNRFVTERLQQLL